jgi:hypothetical protein
VNVALNVLAAAASFVGGLLLASQLAGHVPVPFAGLVAVIVGLVGTAHFTRRAEHARRT